MLKIRIFKKNDYACCFTGFTKYFFSRTYSVDSSESSSDEASDKDVRGEEVEELNKVLSDLVRENRDLEVIFDHDNTKNYVTSKVPNYIHNFF